MCSSPAETTPDKQSHPHDELHSNHDCSSNPPQQPPTIGDIFRQFGPAYRAKYAARMSQDQLRAMTMIQRCRTGELGGAVFHCSHCSTSHHVPRSCGNRHCPQCQGHKARQWLDDQLAKLLPCPYFLITFTVPESLRPFLREHPKQCYKALFDASSATLMELASNPKFVGSSNIGITGVLHTWGRELTYHPHVHYIVPGGAISPDGQAWLPGGDNFFVPVKAASKIFMAKFKDAMKLCGLLDWVPEKAWTQKWVVHSKPVGDGRKALKYLAPYVFRVAISNRRLVSIDPGPDGLGQVTFTVRPSGTQQYVTRRLSAEHFIHRFLQHVLPRGFQKVRRYGFAHPRSKTDWDWLSMLVTVTLNRIYTLTVAAKPQPKQQNSFPCPKCGQSMRCLGFIPVEPIHRLARPNFKDSS